MTPELLQGDCREVLADMEAASVSAVVCDPPYGLTGKLNLRGLLVDWLAGMPHQSKGGGFMGQAWDHLPGPDVWRAVYRVMKPGAYMVAFGGTRTWDLQALSLRLAGFEVRDTLVWLYGSGFPKSLDVSKAIDKAAGAEREVVGRNPNTGRVDGFGANFRDDGWQPPDGVAAITAPATPEAAEWQGWGTALKPAWEPIMLCRKPLEGTVAANVLEHGTGALNVDGCRVGDTVETWPTSRSFTSGISSGYTDGVEKGPTQPTGDAPAGRWPANVVLDEQAAERLDAEVGELHHQDPATRGVPGQTTGATGFTPSAGGQWYADRGGPSRFYYCAKASTRERDGVKHPTVKPQALMRWLVRMVAPPGGLVLDPFAGSGSTLLAAHAEGVQAVGIEQDAEWHSQASGRIERYLARVA